MRAAQAPPDLTPDQIQRFWSHIEFTRSGCWLWTGWRFSNGYGDWRVGLNRPHLLAHRVAYYLATNDWPPMLDHLCRVRHCCNPRHLEPVTHTENLRRGNPISKQRQEATHCKRGHAYAEHGYTYPAGYRACRLCHNLRERIKYRESHPPKPPRATCRRGHPCTPENQYIDRRGYPICRPCRNLSSRKS